MPRSDEQVGGAGINYLFVLRVSRYPADLISRQGGESKAMFFYSHSGQ